MSGLRWSIYKVRGGWTWKIVFRRRLYVGAGFTSRGQAWAELHSKLEDLAGGE